MPWCRETTSGRAASGRRWLDQAPAAQIQLLPARAHRERLRDRPEDAAATSEPSSRKGFRGRRSVRCQCLCDELKSSERVAEGPLRRTEDDDDEEFEMAHVEGLRCRECGRTYEVAPLYTCEYCFGPLEVAYDTEAIGA